MDLKPYSLEIEALDLGEDVRAVGMELLETESRELARGPEASRIWAAVVPAVAGAEPWVLDFFSHLDRVREYFRKHTLEFRQAAERCIVLPQPRPEALADLFLRFEAETFGARAGAAVRAADAALEAELSRRGVDAYHRAYPRYTFCLVCDFQNGMATLLSPSLWASEVLRRARPAAERLSAMISRPQ
jgi:hypothetical protein